MTDLEITLQGVTIPANTSGTLYVYEDVGDDGGANSVTVGDTTINYDNVNSTSLSDGQTSYTLSGFDASGGNRIWPRYEIDNTDDVTTAELVEATDITPTTNVVSVSGTLTSTGSISGSEASTASETGGLTTTALVNGIETANATERGNISASAMLAGSETVIATETGSVSTTSALTGSESIVVSRSGTIEATATLSATEAITVSGQGTLTAGASLAGTETTTTTETGSLSADVTVSGSEGIRSVAGIVWQAEILGSNITEPNLVDVEVTDSINRFAKSALLTIEDSDGTAKSRYPRGERVELYYSRANEAQFDRRWVGTPVQTREKEDRGDIVEVELVGYDFFIRRENVFRTFSSGTSLSEILEETIKNFTPVTWNASNVDVVNDTTLSSSLQFKGEKPDKIIDRVSVESANEEYGVNDDFEFFFREREIERSPSDILAGEWTNYDLPEEGKRSINKVRLFYGEGENRASVVVQDRAEQRDLKDSLDADQNVVLGTSATYPNITTEDNARTVANQILENRSVIQTGDVTTFDRFGMDPGDVFRLEIQDKNIDGDYRLAEITFEWRADTTTCTVAEQTDGTSDELLTELSDDVNRIDARDADPDAPVVQDLNIKSGVEVSVETDITQQTLSDDAFIPGVNRSEVGPQRDKIGFRADSESRSVRTDDRGVLTVNGLNDLRDVLSGASPATRDEIAVGSGSEPVNQTDNTLDTELQRVTAFVPRQISSGVEYEARLPSGGSATTADLTNFALFDSNGDMHQETRIDALSHTNTTTTTISMRMTLSNDADLEGIIPNVGIDRWRDLWAGFSSDNPVDVVYGTGDTTETTGDTTLETQVYNSSIESYNTRSTGMIDLIDRLGTGEANGNDIAEIGEETSDNTLGSRVVFEPISKTSDIALRLRHRLSATNV